MKKRILLPVLLILSLLCLLTSCSGNKLPEGITETQLLTQGRAVVTALNEEQWQQVYEQLREDAQQTTSPEDIQSVGSAVFEKAGAFKSESDVLLTGQKLKSGEEYGTAVFYCKHEKDDVMYRIAFSTDMELIGLQVQKK